MYKLKLEKSKEISKKYNLTYMSKVIGMSRVNLSNIINRKQTTKKTTAYCITKFLNKNAEIENYFEII